MNSSKDLTGMAPSGERMVLRDHVPLSTPLILQVFDTYACNLACGFCHYGLDKNVRPELSTTTFMKFPLFKKMVDDLAEFSEPLKLLRFVGAGESLLNKDILRMVDYACQVPWVNRVELITNGILLDEEKSVALLKSGLDQLRVSIYGVNAETYLDIAKRRVDFDKIHQNVKRFYELREALSAKTRIYVKSMDVCLPKVGDEAKFSELFSGISDAYGYERVVPNVQGLDYTKWLDDTPLYNSSAVTLPKIKVCPQPYHLMTVCSDGRVVPCSNETMIGIGDIRDNSLKEIWFGETLRRVQGKMLDGSTSMKGVSCETCTIVQCRPFPEDILDGEIERLRPILAPNGAPKNLGGIRIKVRSER